MKEGERVCGGRGQFGERPLWDFNAIAELGIAGWVAPGGDTEGWKLFTITKLRFAARFGMRGSCGFVAKNCGRAHA